MKIDHIYRGLFVTFRTFADFALFVDVEDLGDPKSVYLVPRRS